MFEIQEDHVKQILIVALMVDAAIWNVPCSIYVEVVFLIQYVQMVNFVSKEDVFLQFAAKTLIVEWATNAFLKNVSLDVKKMKETVRKAKYVLMTIVQVIICVICCLFALLTAKDFWFFVSLT